MENPRYSIGDGLYDVSTKKTYQIADIKIKDNEYWYGYIINNNIGWVREEDAIWRNKNYANYMYPPLYKVGDTIRIKANGKYGEIKEVHPSDRRSCISYTTLCRFDKKVGHVGESGIEKIDESLIPSPKFKIGEVVFIPDSTEGGTVRAIEQREGSYCYEVYYNDEASKKRGAFSYFYEKRLITFDRISTNPKFSLESLNSKKMEDEKSITPKFKEGEHVYINANERMGTIVNVPNHKGYPYYVKTDGTPGYYYNEFELKPIAKGKKPNIPIRSIKSLIEKSVVDPSSNQAEKKAIDLFVRSVHTMSDSYVGDSECLTDETSLKEFKDQLNIIEKMAIEFYKKIKP